MTVMAVNSIDSNNRKYGFVTLMEGATIGALAGTALKYTYPVTSQEKNTPEYKRVISEIQNKKNIYGPENEEFLKGIKSKGNLSLAEDTFVKMYEGMKDGDKTVFGAQKLREILSSLRKNDPASANEFRQLLMRAREASQESVKRCIDAYNIATKNIRPTAFFLAGGAVVGALIAMVHDVLRTDVKH